MSYTTCATAILSAVAYNRMVTCLVSSPRQSENVEFAVLLPYLTLTLY